MSRHGRNSAYKIMVEDMVSHMLRTGELVKCQRHGTIYDPKFYDCGQCCERAVA